MSRGYMGRKNTKYTTTRGPGTLIKTATLIIVVVCLTSAENADQQNHHHREKRFVFFDTASPINIGFLVTVPFGVALPLVKNRSKREVPDGMRSARTEFNVPSRQTEELLRVTSMLDLLEVHGFNCRLRFICNLAERPESFDPLSRIVLKPLSGNQLPPSHAVRTPRRENGHPAAAEDAAGSGETDEYEMYVAASLFGRRGLGCGTGDSLQPWVRKREGKKHSEEGATEDEGERIEDYMNQWDTSENSTRNSYVADKLANEDGRNVEASVKYEKRTGLRKEMKIRSSKNKNLGPTINEHFEREENINMVKQWSTYLEKLEESEVESIIRRNTIIFGKVGGQEHTPKGKDEKELWNEEHERVADEEYGGNGVDITIKREEDEVGLQEELKLKVEDAKLHDREKNTRLLHEKHDRLEESGVKLTKIAVLRDGEEERRKRQVKMEVIGSTKEKEEAKLIMKERLPWSTQEGHREEGEAIRRRRETDIVGKEFEGESEEEEDKADGGGAWPPDAAATSGAAWEFRGNGPRLAATGGLETVLAAMTSCPTDAEGFLNMDVLRLWKILSKYFEINLVQ